MQPLPRSAIPDGPRCHRCAFFRHDAVTFTEDGKDVEPPAAFRKCRRYPTVVEKHPADFCGEWRSEEP